MLNVYWDLKLNVLCSDIEHQLSMTEMLLLMTLDTPNRRQQLSCAFGNKNIQAKFMSISLDNLEEVETQSACCN